MKRTRTQRERWSTPEKVAQCRAAIREAPERVQLCPLHASGLLALCSRFREDAYDQLTDVIAFATLKAIECADCAALSPHLEKLTPVREAYVHMRAAQVEFEKIAGLSRSTVLGAALAGIDDPDEFS